MNIRYLTPIKTNQDFLESLGDIPASRVRWTPTPGTATSEDLLKPENEGCELVDGTLVEKPVGWKESYLGARLLILLGQFILERDLGVITGEQGLSELFAGTIRIPDIAFTSWDKLPSRQLPTEPIPHLVPDLTIEVLSPSNSPKEMSRKREEYFRAGVGLVWEVDPRSRKVFVYTSANEVVELNETDTLTGGSILPGFTLPLTRLFN